jgi:RNA polymerase primary sigma factor
MVELVNQYRQVIADLQAKLADNPTPPTPAQIAEEMKLPVKKIMAIKEIVDSINTPLQAESSQTNQSLEETMPAASEPLPEDELTGTEELHKLVKMLDRLEKREAEVLKLRFGINGTEPLTLKQIGAKLGLTRERARQLQQGALKQLNELMSYE